MFLFIYIPDFNAICQCLISFSLFIQTAYEIFWRFNNNNYAKCSPDSRTFVTWLEGSKRLHLVWYPSTCILYVSNLYTSDVLIFCERENIVFWRAFDLKTRCLRLCVDQAFGIGFKWPFSRVLFRIQLPRIVFVRRVQLSSDE